MLKFKQVALTLILTVAFSFIIANSGLSFNPPDTPVFVQEYIGQTDFIEGRLSQLLGAMSQDQMNWTPAEGVRTCGQIYLHVAVANHMLVSFMSGAELEIPTGDTEKNVTNKDEIAKMLKDSFAAVKEAAGKLKQDDLDKVSKTPFGMDMSLRNFMISLLSHSHEHLGQGVAYARMNGVVPPWSAKQEDEG